MNRPTILAFSLAVFAIPTFGSPASALPDRSGAVTAASDLPTVASQRSAPARTIYRPARPLSGYAYYPPQYYDSYGYLIQPYPSYPTVDPNAP